MAALTPERKQEYETRVCQVLSVWASKVSEIGQQALLGAEGVEESQGRKDHGIRRPCLARQRLLWQA